MQQKRYVFTGLLALTALSFIWSPTSVAFDQESEPPARQEQLRPPLAAARRPVVKPDDLSSPKQMQLTEAEVAVLREKQEQQIREFTVATEEAMHQIERRKAAFEKEQTELLQHETDSATMEMEKLSRRYAADQAEAKPEISLADIKAMGRREALPHITGHIGALQSGNGVLIFGERFGSCCGKVTLQSMGYDMALEVDEWHDNVISGFVPARASVSCLTGEVQVMTQQGKASNRLLLPVPQIYKSLPSEDVKIVQCSNDSNHYNCNHIREVGDCWWMFGGVDKASDLGGGSIYGGHGNCAAAVGDDSGTDIYEIDLKRGWVIDNARFVSSISEQGEAWTNPRSGLLPAGYQEGASYYRPEIRWLATPGDSLVYVLFIGIRGPECSSH